MRGVSAIQISIDPGDCPFMRPASSIRKSAIAALPVIVVETVYGEADELVGTRTCKVPLDANKDEILVYNPKAAKCEIWRCRSLTARSDSTFCTLRAIDFSLAAAYVKGVSRASHGMLDMWSEESMMAV
jgi:hypothetical protein